MEANVELGFKSDEREFEICKTILAYLGVGQVNVLTNNPAKIESLRASGVNVVERIPIIVGINGHNQKYLKTMVEKMGHIINTLSISVSVSHQFKFSLGADNGESLSTPLGHRGHLSQC